MELVGAPLLVVQQPVVPQVDRVHAGRRRHEAVEVVRRLPRSRGVLQRPLRPADQGADRHAGGAGRARLHVVPRDHARRAARWARATSTIEYPPLHDLAASEQPAPALRARPADSTSIPQPHRETFLKPFHREQTPEFCSSCHKVHLDVPVNALPLVPRLQRLRQLAGVGRVGRGRALVLLPAEAAEVRRLPHAARAVERSGGEERHGALAPLRRRRTRRCRSSTATPSS